MFRFAITLSGYEKEDLLEYLGQSLSDTSMEEVLTIAMRWDFSLLKREFKAIDSITVKRD